MRLNAVVPLLLLAVSLGASHALGNFAAADGFSGMRGATCASCHNSPHPTQDDAAAVLEGLPPAWDPGVAYPLTIRIEGGPTPAPSPQPQGGFEIATSNATLRIPDDGHALMRQPDVHSITYRPEGTLMREWEVVWVAPDLSAFPAQATVWLAVVAANGNHVIATNVSDGGERLDSVDSLVVVVPPSAGTLEAWRALPLAPPKVTVAQDTQGWLVTGRHADTLATHVAWSIDGGPWQSLPTAPVWQIDILRLGAGEHTLDVRSEGQERTSTSVSLSFGTEDGPFRESPAIATALLPILLLTLASLLVRK